MTDSVAASRVDRVVLTLIIVLFSLSLGSLILDYNWPPNETFSFSREEQTLPRLVLYWSAGSVFAIVSAFIWCRRLVLARSLAYSGAYLMLLGVNDGLWGRADHMLPRIAACAISLLAACVVAARTRNPSVVASA